MPFDSEPVQEDFTCRGRVCSSGFVSSRCLGNWPRDSKQNRQLFSPCEEGPEAAASPEPRAGELPAGPPLGPVPFVHLRLREAASPSRPASFPAPTPCAPTEVHIFGGRALSEVLGFDPSLVGAPGSGSIPEQAARLFHPGRKLPDSRGSRARESPAPSAHPAACVGAAPLIPPTPPAIRAPALRASLGPARNGPTAVRFQGFSAATPG